ncbi:oxidoreductase [Bosea sp. AS-1]|uniref:oxidoreductase n=1 Tax=Bosea sp. AS-1 TaxID=2015316 RepID=UPI000B782CC5|nr:oxidoreductase [Bosea sp. AS-1]
MTPGVTDEVLAETLAAYEACERNQTKTALALGLSRGGLQSRLHQAAARGMMGTKPVLPGFEISKTTAVMDESGRIVREFIQQRPERSEGATVPEGHIVKGISTLTDGAGKIVAQWTKTALDTQAQIDAIQAAAQAFKDDLPRAKAIKAPKASHAELLNMFVVTDVHMGMLAWREESGADYDLGIAEKLLLDWFTAAIDLAPNAHTAVLAQLGDLLHHDGHESVTPTHRHVLDADSRLQKVIRVVIRTVRQIIRMLLEKHQHVHVVMADANHDPASGAWLRELFAAFYEDEPRVTVDSTASTYYVYEWGETSLFMHHGHRRNIGNVDSVFAGKWREIYGRTKYSYAHIGHLHSDELKSTNLMKVERHETLAAPDAYAANGGWLSGRSAKVITYSKRCGEVFRSTLSAEMVSGWVRDAA